MNKKVFTIIALVLCMFAVIGCGSSKKNSNKHKNSTNKESSEKVADDKIDYYWTGNYKLKDGTGELKINKTDNKNMTFSISGQNKSNQSIPQINSKASVKEDFATYKGEDGLVISFCFVNGTGIDVRTYDKDGNETFSGTYEQVN